MALSLPRIRMAARGVQHLLRGRQLTWRPQTRALGMVPIVIQNAGRGERAFDIFSRLLQERVVCLMGPIDDQVAAVIVAQLLFLESEDPKKPISLYINSPGGIISSGLSMYDTMQYIQPEVSTICMGQACSMASLILAAGAPGKRFALPHSRVMVHQPSGGTQGQASDIAIQAKEILNLRLQINELYASHTGQPIDVIEKSMERDTFMSPTEAKTFGLIDSIITHRQPRPDAAEPNKK